MPYITLSIVSFISAYLLLKYYISLSKYHKIVAVPNARSLHKTIIPTGGGLIFAVLHIIFILFAFKIIQDYEIRESIYKLIIGSVMVIILGFVDDKFNLRAKQKLICQIIIALVMILLGFRISHLSNPFGGAFILGNISIPLTVVWYLLVMNAINLIDGLDGLAAGITIITCIVMLFFSYASENQLVFVNCIILISTLSAFLLFNYHPAKLFMGDTGSLFIGYLIASLAIAGNETQFKGLTTFTLLVPITVILVPLGDTLFTILRRIKNKQYIFQADRNHFHHKLIEKGFSHHIVTLMCWFFTLIFGLISLGYIYIPKNIMLAILLFVGVLMISLFLYIYKKEK